MRRILLSSLAIALALSEGARARVEGQDKSDEDLITRVLRDEIDRSMKRLKMDKAAGPYFVAYTVRETTSFEVQASFGAIGTQGENRRRSLSVDVRIGDYSLDNTNFSSNDFSFDFGGVGARGGGGALTVDDNYDALRHAVWLETDHAYKKAIEDLEKKKAYLQENTVKDRPDDLSREEAFVLVKPTAKLDLDRERWAKAARSISAVFRDYPAVQNSMVIFAAEAGNRWFINSEGFRNRGGDCEVGMILMAVAQADDGMKVADYELFVGRSERDLPSPEAMEKAARGLGERLTQLAKAPLVAEEYRGPILLEGQAAAEFFGQTLAPHLGNAHEVVGSKGQRSSPLKENIGQRVLPNFITVSDDPLVREAGGAPILGGWEVDDDGVKAEKLTLVEKGILKTFCMSRIPTRHVKRSNGHSRQGRGSVSTLFIQSESKLSANDLKAKLIELGKEEGGLKHVYIARRITNMLAMALNPSVMVSMMMGGGGAGAIALMPPILLYRVSVEDGKEELVRGAQFGSLTLSVLRDIPATGDSPAAYAALRDSQSPTYVVTPSLLLKEIEIRKPPQETEKPTVLKNPFFEK